MPPGTEGVKRGMAAFTGSGPTFRSCRAKAGMDAGLAGLLSRSFCWGYRSSERASSRNAMADVTGRNENVRDYEYQGLMAECWDLFRGDTSQWADRSLYRDLIRDFGEPVLDVGCGTGR